MKFIVELDAGANKGTDNFAREAVACALDTIVEDIRAGFWGNDLNDVDGKKIGFWAYTNVVDWQAGTFQHEAITVLCREGSKEIPCRSSSSLELSSLRRNKVKKD